MARDLSDFCVYTIVDGERLHQTHRERRPLRRPERKPWTTGYRLWREAKAAGRSMPVVIADACDTSQLLYWGILTGIEISSEGTRYRVDRLRRVPRGYTTQQLVLRSTGRRIARGFIRPYAICRTPSFVSRSRVV
jgi:hypothetical protein